MKKKRTLWTLLILAALVILAACEASDAKSTTNNDETEINNVSESIDTSEDSSVVDTVTKEEDENEEQDKFANQTVTEKDNSESSGSESKEIIQITSGEEAVEYLKQHHEEGTNEDVSFGTDGKLLTDSTGSYYMVQLIDIPIRVSGKTGTLGYYKVYQDGTYEPYQVEAINSDNDNAKNIKEAYLRKLNDIEKEMEKSRQNSDATTTKDMEEEEADRYKTWDKALNEIYGVLEDQLSNEQMEELRKEQRNWIKYRDEAAKEVSEKNEGGSLQTLEYVTAQTDLTKERSYELVENYMK